MNDNIVAIEINLRTILKGIRRSLSQHTVGKTTLCPSKFLHPEC